MYKYDIDRIEAVQRRFTKRLRGLYHMPNTSRLCQLHLDSLASRWFSETAPPAPSLVGVEELPAPSSRDALFPKAIGLI